MPIIWHIQIYSSKYMHVNIYIYSKCNIAYICIYIYIYLRSIIVYMYVYI